MTLWKRLTGQALKAEAEAQRRAAERAAQTLRSASPTRAGRGRE
ncbi:hypothetical protein BCF33_1125 [Hasllibacter halocynthiae]|uniref:Uncharacterized protein n=1 Tax=Hasllibacter halocynthiae TaxID=595589 RepID=A0A2T0X9G1_9RHOB|nr:hypothetical protein [Hasllibacter halocynthiae]PRY95504.1 hypothetical protein BCF33_1125 [Hasllibacter halocynthiae]